MINIGSKHTYDTAHILHFKYPGSHHQASDRILVDYLTLISAELEEFNEFGVW